MPLELCVCKSFGNFFILHYSIATNCACESISIEMGQAEVLAFLSS